MRQTITIATGVPALDRKIAEEYPHCIFLKTENELRDTQAPLIVWSSFLLTGQSSSEKKIRLKQWMKHFRHEGIRSVFLSPHSDWIAELAQEGLDGFVPITNNNVPLKQLFSTMEALLQGPIESTSPVLTFSDEGAGEPERVKKSTKVWAFWSAKPGMGVSTLTQSLAVELSQAGHKTLLIEWDTMYQSIPYSLGLSDPKRCIERWITDEEAGLNPRLEDYLLNKTVCLQEHKDKGIRKAIEALPDNLYVLAPSNQLKLWDMVTLEIPTVKKALDSLTELDFSVVLIDVPSEITHSATAVTIQKADQTFAVVDSKGSHVVMTKMAIDFMRKELNVSFDLILNNVDSPQTKHIEKGIGKKATIILPYDSTLGQRSMDLNPKAGDEYQSVLTHFLTEQGYVSKRKKHKFRKKKADKHMKNTKQPENRLASFITFS